MKKILLALLSGVLLALGWPTYGFPFILFIAFVPLLIAEYNIRNFSRAFKRTQLFLLSYLTFFIWNAITTYWIAFSDFGGAMVAILANSLFMSIIIMIYYYIARRTTQIRALAFFLTLWIAFEKFHLSWEISWPWLTLGNAFSQYNECIQWYEYTGVFGGSFWILITNVTLFYSYISVKDKELKKIIPKALLKGGVLISVPILVSLAIYYTYTESKETVNVVLLQPNTDPYTEKYTTKNKDAIRSLFNLAVKKTNDSTDFLIAPETVLADNDGLDIDKFVFSSEQSETKIFLNKYPNLNYLFGAEFYSIHKDERTITSTSNKYKDGVWVNSYNSAVLMNLDNNAQIYHKSKFVPGIENFPYKSIFNPFLGNIMINMGGSVGVKTPQEERTAFTTNSKYKVAPIICYESIYGEYVTGFVKNGANFLAIITNDGWWKDTQGHKQHLSYARLRAIENRKSIARSANTGTSAFINEKGDITSIIPYNTKNALSSKISVNTKKTLYVHFGDYIAYICIFFATALFLSIGFKRKK